jgi:hypothetical protein
MQELRLCPLKATTSCAASSVSRLAGAPSHPWLQGHNIEAVGDETGVHYGGEGIALEDQPLLAAIRVLIGRRFGVPDDLE